MADELKASDVFLKLWRFRTTHDDEETPADFALCATAWAEIRRMEDDLAWAELRDRPEAEEKEQARKSPAPVSDSDQGGKLSSWQIWKEKVRARLMATRFSVSQVAEASEVKVEDVRGLIDSTRIPANLIRAIERGLDKLEGKP
ncbi:MAG: hypothetical protein J6T26_01285 [Firmicutes bacterium]|nr:hypothetical protein [Bacillota bacterium]